MYRFPFVNIEGESLEELYTNAKLAPGSSWETLRCSGGVRTGRFVKMGQVREVVTGFKHRGVHQWRQCRICSILKSLGRDLDSFALQCTLALSVPKG